MNSLLVLEGEPITALRVVPESTLTPCLSVLSVLQEIALHAPLPPGLRGPMAGHQQEVSHLSSGHRNTAEPRQLMSFQLPPPPPPPPPPRPSPSRGSCFLPPRLAGRPPPPPPPPPPVGCFAKCLRTSCDITTLLTHALLSQARKTKLREANSFYIEAHPSGSKRHTHTHTHTHTYTHMLMLHRVYS